MDTENGLIWAFVAPVIFVLIVNISMFIKALTIAKRSIDKRQNTEDSAKTMTLIKGT